MSRASTAFDAFKARVVAVLPNHSELSNPYSLEQNLETAMRQGFGIQILPAENPKRNLSCKLSVRRGMALVLTRKFYASELNRAAKESVEKQLLEDQYLVIKDLEADPTLGVSSVVTRSEWQSDGGIQFVFTDDKPFYSLITNFELEYLEDIS